MTIETTEVEQRLTRRIGKAVRRYGLLEDGDRVMVAVSGGKDSYVLLHLLEKMRRRIPTRFELIAVHLDQRQPGYDGRPLVQYLESHGFEYRVVSRDTYSVVRGKTRPGQAYCFLCSRLRRGILYQTAVELGCTRIALGHHRDDVLETLLLNLVFSGQLKAMPPKLLSDDRRNVVIRPLVLCAEDDIRDLAEILKFPILPCGLCSSQKNLQRVEMRKILDLIESEHPGASYRMIAGLANVRASHLLDQTLWNKLELPGLSEAAQVGRPGSCRSGTSGDSK